jgi:hypothetical protein
MGKYSENLPQLDGTLFLTDGGLETTLIFHEELDLPEFAAYPLLATLTHVPYSISIFIPIPPWHETGKPVSFWSLLRGVQARTGPIFLVTVPPSWTT